MNIVNEMVSDLNSRKKIETDLKKERSKSNGSRGISWQASSTIILLIGISTLSYAIWFYNTQSQESPLIRVAQFSKPNLSNDNFEPPHAPIKNPMTEKKEIAPLDTTAKKGTSTIKPEKTTAKAPIKSATKPVIKPTNRKIEKPITPKIAKPIKTATKKPVKIAKTDPNKFNKQPIQLTDTQSAKKYYANALVKLNEGDVITAKSLLQKTLSLKITHVAARKTLAGIYINEKELSAAETTLQMGIEKVPEASIFYHWLGRIYMEQGDFEKASTLLLSGSKHAKAGDYFALLALAQQNTPGFKSAIESYRKALNFQPKESKWWLGLGIVLEKSQNWKEAESAYETALQSENLPFNLHSQTSSRLTFVKNQIALLDKK
ncbi:MAG: hypothetical protein OEM38_10760 [Gammaproteobacteria bacterium]|nr:hypothetical protein [Gammaproteobacteria bacterium]